MNSTTHDSALQRGYINRGRPIPKAMMESPDPDRWRSKDKLRYYKTAMFCAICQKVVPVVDLKFLARTAVLFCKHERGLSV
jgi:hypothetical protein